MHDLSTTPSGRPGARGIVIVGASVLTCALLVGAFLLAGQGSHVGAIGRALTHGDLGALRLQLGSLGAWAALALILVALAHTVVPFPAELLAAAGGFALGFVLALPVVLAGLLLSALIAYELGGRIGRPVVARMVGAERLRKIEGRINRGGPRPLLALRLIPLVPFSPACFACGLIRVPRRRYLWTTALGILPELALVTFLGARVQSFSFSQPAVWGPLAGILLLLVIGPPLAGLARRSS